MAYTDNYERDIYGIIAFWVQNNFDHSRFFDREISHYELELAHATCEFHSLLTYTLDKSLRCEVIVSTPQSLLDHMIREAEETMSVFKLIQSGQTVSPTEASLHENFFWLRQMGDHLRYISHYLDPSNYELHERVRRLTKKFDNLFLQANALRTMIRIPHNEGLPVLESFNQFVINEVKSLEAFKLELDDLIKQCAAVVTSPPDLLEHIAREAHHFWKNLEEKVIL